MNDDSQLRAYFASLRRAGDSATPSLERVIGRAARRSHDRGLKVAASVVFSVVTVVILWAWNPHRSPPLNAAAPRLADWRAPTDFLLDTPGRELLHTIPVMGRYPSALGPFPPTRTTPPAPRAAPEHS
jgi:hypothetical protein